MNCERFRWFFTSRGFLVIGGKSASQNELVVQQHVDLPDLVLHTELPGSPFCVIKAFSQRGRKISSQDIKEAAQFCACFGQVWKSGLKTAEVAIFKAGQITKKKGMPLGTFLVAGKRKLLKVKLELCLGFQQGKLRAAPCSSLEKSYATITPGKLSKEQAAGEIAEKLKLNKEEALSALPSTSINIRWIQSKV